MMEHLSADEISDWIVAEPDCGLDSERERHARECRQCRDEVLRVQQALELFRDSTRLWSERRYLERAVPSRRTGRARFLAAPAAILLAVVAGTVLLLHSPVPLGPPRPAPFVAIPYVVPPASYERIRVRQMDVPLTALIAAGFEVHSPDAGAFVSTEVLIGQDGRAVAIRLPPGR